MAFISLGLLRTANEELYMPLAGSIAHLRYQRCQSKHVNEPRPANSVRTDNKATAAMVATECDCSSGDNGFHLLVQWYSPRPPAFNATPADTAAAAASAKDVNYCLQRNLGLTLTPSPKCHCAQSRREAVHTPGSGDMIITKIHVLLETSSDAATLRAQVPEVSTRKTQ